MLDRFQLHATKDKAAQSPRKLFDGQHFEVRAYFSWEEEGGSIPHRVMYVHNLKT